MWQWSGLWFGVFPYLTDCICCPQAWPEATGVGIAAGQPGPCSCLMVELKVAPMRHREEIGLLLPPSQEISLVPSCGTPSSSLTHSQRVRKRGSLPRTAKRSSTGQLPREGLTCDTRSVPEASNRGQQPKAGTASQGAERQGKAEDSQDPPALLW